MNNADHKLEFNTFKKKSNIHHYILNNFKTYLEFQKIELRISKIRDAIKWNDWDRKYVGQTHHPFLQHFKKY